MLTRVMFVAVLGLIGALPGGADDKTETDLKAMVGDWKVEKAELQGKELTDAFKSLKFGIGAPGKYTVEFAGEKDEGGFTIDPAKTPKEMDITSTAGPNKGKVIKAIYKLNGDRFTVCYDFGKDKPARPTKFESKADTPVLLVTYQRSKK